MVHSQLDYRLDVSEGLQLFDTLQLRGVPSEMLYFPDEGHWVLKPQNSQLWWKTVNAWVDKWTGTAATSQLNGSGPMTYSRSYSPRVGWDEGRQFVFPAQIRQAPRLPQ